MEEAARAFAAGKNDVAQAKANEAKMTLVAAGDILHDTNRDKFEAAISDAARHAAVLLEEQQDLSAETAALATALGTNKPDQRQQRDLQAQAYRETVLGANADALGSEIANLNQMAAQAGQPDAIRELAEAQRVIKRTPPTAKMSDAVIDLNNASPSAAQSEQKDAETALAKIVESLQSSSDALAANREAELNRAARAARDAQNSLATLQGKSGGQEEGSPAKGKGDQPQAGTQGAANQATGDAQANGPGGGDATRQVAYNLGQLASVIDNRQLVPQNDVDQLKQMSMDKSELEKRLAVDPKFLQDVSALVGDINGKIEAELEAKAQAGKLFSSQREECPPNYRQFVNKYFEALSQVAPSTAPPDKPAPTGQP
jgi:hypothetical protein